MHSSRLTLLARNNLRDLSRKFSNQKISAKTMNEMLDYSERRIRTAITKAPDGEYCGEAFLDDDGIHNHPVAIKVKIKVEGDKLEIDFKGTAR